MNIINVLRAMGNEKRLEILQWLKEPKKHFKSATCDVEIQGVCIGLIEQKCGLSQSTVSQYISILKQAELITTYRKGQWTYCKRNEKTIAALIQKLEEL